QRLSDARVNPRPVSARAVAAQIAVRKLVDIKRNQLNRRIVMPALPPVTLQKTIDEVLRMRVFPHLRRQKRDALARLWTMRLGGPARLELERQEPGAAGYRATHRGNESTTR